MDFSNFVENRLDYINNESLRKNVTALMQNSYKDKTIELTDSQMEDVINLIQAGTVPVIHEYLRAYHEWLLATNQLNG